MNVQVTKGNVAEWQALSLAEGETALWWLGQAGFAFRYGAVSVLVDPYLSDSLAHKYAGTRFPHIRMMSIPVAPACLPGVDWVCCTHRHTDHMDPETLVALAEANPDCRFVVPRSAWEHATRAIGLAADRVCAVAAGETLELSPEFALTAVPSAHEELAIDDEGRHAFLGYVLRLGNLSVYHSGDCVPYAGLTECLAAQVVDLALLPVNGRDERRLCSNVPGNFHLQEAMELCALAGIRWMIAHHFGMFDFNTVDPVVLSDCIAGAKDDVRVLVPQAGLLFRVSKVDNAG